MDIHFSDRHLYGIQEKISEGQRLRAEDGLMLYRSPDITGLGHLADQVRRKRHGNTAYYVYNQHINYSNICINRCRFCAFARDKEEKGSYTYSIEDVEKHLRERIEEPVREIHMVGGLNPALEFSYYPELLRCIKKIRPDVSIKAFTAVEIDYLSQISGLSLEDTIAVLKEAGLDMIPGGGAEILDPRIHAELFPRKISGKRWLEVMEALHGAGLSANASMLYGHIESREERIRHLISLRELQDKTGGFSAFIPLAFHPQNTKLSHLPSTTAYDDLKTVAIARLMLDNFDHIKAYWVMIGEKLAQTALFFGADDLDGTIVEEKITHMAGASSPKGLHREEMEHLITAAGFVPVERDSFYQPVRNAAANAPVTNPVTKKKSSAELRRIAEKVKSSERIDAQEALTLYQKADLLSLGALADGICRRMHPERIVTYVVDRNINYTNVCVSGCRFCAFYRSADAPDAYVISREDLHQKIQETIDMDGTQILLQGGMHPDLDLDYYTGLLRDIHENFHIHIHGFSPPEIACLARKSGLSIEKTLEELKKAGLNSIPGGGAEILVDEIREQLSPHKCTAETWLCVMGTAHTLGLRTTATMMFGHLEKAGHVIDHLMNIRELQDATGGFTAFIPWTFQPGNTKIDVVPRTAAEYLRVLSLSRIVLDNIANIQASWVTQGDKIAQTSLAFGANDLGSTMIEENVVAAAGVSFRLPESEMIRLIQSAGFQAVQRDCFYNHLRVKA
ncbi:MAG: cyclic dehypoxanthinyl futalosine synthase [Desulfococcaceae bacterium]|jgi:aminodeoxyfutalosine synthase|nr:cyclic dehypoxanthinyl futalosine synthase [Desulfococcaceae bacterium]